MKEENSLLDYWNKLPLGIKILSIVVFVIAITSLATLIDGAFFECYINNSTIGPDKICKLR